MNPEFTLDFIGGPMDGQTLSSESELAGSKGHWLPLLIASRIDQQQRMETRFESLMRWRIPSAAIRERAKAEGWSDAELKYRMQYHNYEIVSYQEGHGMILFRAEFSGTTEGA